MDKLNWSDNPEYLEGLLAGYALGDLSPEEMDEVQAYLDEHPASADELAKLQTTLALLPLSLPESQPSPDLKERILTAAGEATAVYQQRITVVPSTAQTTAHNNVVNMGERRRSKRNQGAWFAGSIAAGLLAVLGFQNYQLSQDVASLRREVTIARAERQNRTQLVEYAQMVSMLRQPDNRLMTLKGMEDKSSGSLVLVPMEKKAVLTLQNVPKLPKDQMYRLWAMTDPKTKVYCAEFKPDADGMVSITIPLEQLRNAQSVAVTIDPKAADTAKPVGDMVMSGAVSI